MPTASMVVRMLSVFAPWMVAVMATGETPGSELSLAFDAGRIAWAEAHCADGKPALAARMLIEAGAGHVEFAKGLADGSAAGDADLQSACLAIEALYGISGAVAPGMWQSAPQSGDRPGG